MRRCVAEAAHHTGQRTAFGKVLSETPIMRNVLCDLVADYEQQLISDNVSGS